MTSGRRVPDGDEGKQGEDEERPFWVPPPEHLAAFVAFQKERARKQRQRELALPVHKKVRIP